MQDELAADVLEQDGPEQQDSQTAKAQDAGVAKANQGDDEHQERKRLGGWQRKIQRLEARLEEKDSLITSLLKEKGGAKSADAQQDEDKQPTRPVRPKLTDFSTYDEYEKAMDKYETDRDDYHEKFSAYQSRQTEKKVSSQVEQKSQQQRVAETFASQVSEAREKHDDFDEVAFREDVPMTDVMRDAYLTSELGAEIAYYMGQHPEEAERIANLSPIVAVREIGKIEARLAGANEAEEQTEKAPPPKPKAPKPPTPVKKSAPTAPVDLNDPNVPMDVWLKERNKQVHG